MAKHSNAGTNRQFAQLVTSDGVDWIREIADQGLSQSKAVLDGYLTIGKKAVETADRQVTDTSKRSILVAEKTLSNTFEFARELLAVREPQQLATSQSEFVSRQTEIFADQMKVLGQNARDGGVEIAHATARVAQRTLRHSG